MGEVLVNTFLKSIGVTESLDCYAAAELLRLITQILNGLFRTCFQFDTDYRY